jgi:hypothetical protein
LTNNDKANNQPKLYPKQNYNYKHCSLRKQNYRLKSSSTGVQYVTLQKYRRSFSVDPLDITAAFHRRFPEQGHILNTGGAALTKVKLLADRRPHLRTYPLHRTQHWQARHENSMNSLHQQRELTPIYASSPLLLLPLFLLLFLL